MDTQPIIRDGAPEDLEALIDTLSDSFSGDPVLNWVFPRVQMYPDFFRLLIENVYLPRGIVHMDEQGHAAALWLPPEERFEMPPRLGLLKFALQLILREGLSPLGRLRRQGRVFARHLPKEPHYYLQFLGCQQSMQGQGLGAALLKEGTRICDARGMPAFLESSNIRNVPLYERHGFAVCGEEAVAENGPMAWFMWREPR